MSRFLSLLAALCLCGCAAVGPSFEPAPAPDGTKAVVYIYRLESFALGARDAYFYVNDQNVVDLSNNGYTWFSVPAGDYVLKQKWPINVTFGMKTLEMPVRWEGGKTYYYRLATGAGNAPVGISIRWTLSEPPASVAREEILKAKHQPAHGAAKLLKEDSGGASGAGQLRR